MMGALLSQRAAAAGAPLSVRTAGMRDTGMPPTQGTIDMLAGHGLDVTGHRSDLVTAEVADAADLILAAEKQHVVSVAALAPGLFDRTFTLPEFTRLGRDAGRRDGAAVPTWLDTLAVDRPRGIDYLSAAVEEVDDPTGQRPAEWRRAFDSISSLVDEVVVLLT